GAPSPSGPRQASLLVLVVVFLTGLAFPRDDLDGDGHVGGRARECLGRLLFLGLLRLAASLVPRLGHSNTLRTQFRGESTTQPGGQPSLRPASRCRCTCSTLWPASGPWLKTSR